MAKTRKVAERNRRGATKTTQPTSPSPEASSSGSNVEVWTDDEWEPALRALESWKPGGEFTGKPDPTPLAKLLRSGKPVPEAVAVGLGVLLDPEWGNKGPKLTMSIPTRYSGYGDWQTIKAMIVARRELEIALQQSGKLEFAIEYMREKTGRSRSWLMKVWALDAGEIVRRTSKYNPQPFLSSRESDKS